MPVQPRSALLFAVAAATGLMVLVAPAAGGQACAPSPTRPGPDEWGSPDARGPLVGAPPILAGPFPHARAYLHVTRTPEGLGGKLYYLLDPAGPRHATMTMRRLDGPGRGLFEVHDTDAAGRSVRRYVPVLPLDRERTRRENPPRGRATLLGQPGGVRLPSPGCYRLTVRWAGGGWARTVRTSLAPFPRASSTEHALLAPLEARERRNPDAGPLRQLDQLR